ncbi:hypothetical protein FHS08_000259 [Microbacterium ulmi]|nr:hypothetical protein [Microbacterium ulmi]
MVIDDGVDEGCACDHVAGDAALSGLLRGDRAVPFALGAADEPPAAADGDVAELLHVDMDQRARRFVLVAAGRFAGFHIDMGEPVQPAAVRRQGARGTAVRRWGQSHAQLGQQGLVRERGPACAGVRSVDPAAHSSRPPPHRRVARDQLRRQREGRAADAGHASAAMTLDTYADLFDDDLDAVASRLNEAMPLVALPAGPQTRYARPT